MVAAVFSKTSSLGIKVRGLEAFVTLCGGSSVDDSGASDGLDGRKIDSSKSKSTSSAILDKYTVQEKVVPLLKAMKTKEPAVMMAALAVFRQVGQIADADFLAMEALPILWNFSLGPLLNLQQFQEFMDLIKKLSSRIEQEQIRKLRDLTSSDSAKDVPRSNDLMSVGASNGFSNVDGNDTVGENDFERLVLGKGKANGNAMLNDTSRPQASNSLTDPPVFSWSSTPLSPNQTNQNSMSSVVDPPSRTITPDKSLSAFGTLNPISSTSFQNSARGNTTANNLSSFAPMQLTTMQQTPATTSPWSFPPAQQPLQPSQSTFSTPPPSKPQPTTPFSTFSLPPPPMSPAQRPGIQSQQNSGYFGTANIGHTGQLAMGANQQPQAKSGLDKYESLI